jgi:hypothetical protein
VKWSSRFQKQLEWHSWFAWYPVTIDLTGERVWLEVVERRRDSTPPDSLYWVYR